MLLNQLIKNAPAIEIQHIHSDSRKKRANGLFFCVKGMMYDGHQFVDEAIKNGAIAVVHSEELSRYQDGIYYFKVKDVVETYNLIANLFYGEPSHKMKLFGVTGTNGKSSIARIIQEILQPETPTGYVGSISISYGAVKLPGMMTTPNIDDLHAILKEMVDAGMKATSMEVNSIAIEQRRMDSVHFDYAIFSNLSHDHLDFHGTMQNYFEAKKNFFDHLEEGSVAITNLDDPYGLKMVEDSKAQVVTYGTHPDADYRIGKIQLKATGTIFSLFIQDKEYRVETNLVAKFNVLNLVAALASLHEAGLEMPYLLDRAKQLNHIDGRMDCIEKGQSFNILIDLAHTVENIEQVCEFAATITPKQSRIFIVSGSAGKKDRSKRLKFGELFDRYGDMMILTEDDPRDENPREICLEIAQGIQKKPYLIIPDRYDAIRQALELADPNDMVLILGKGTEKFMEHEFGRIPYLGDDTIVEEVLQKYVLIQGGQDYEFEQVY